MKIIVPGAALALTLMSWAAVAEEPASGHPQASMEDECRLMGEQHGMKDEKMDAWMKRCMEIVGKMKDDENADDGGDAEDSQDGDEGKGNE